MNWTGLLTTIKKRVGIKTAAKEKLKQSFRIYEKCDTCPLSVYIDAVCNDNLKGFVISGNPPEEILQINRSALTVEFSEMSGNAEVNMITNLLKQIYLIQTKIEGLKICLKVVDVEMHPDVLDYLKKHGVRLVNPKNKEEVNKLISELTGRMNGHIIRFDELKKKYDTINKASSGEKPTPEYYTSILIMLSKYMGFHLNKEKITLSYFALCLKNYNRENEMLLNKK